MKTIGKRILSLALCLVMVLTLLPTAVFAVREYDAWVNGEQFTDGNLTIQCGSGTATYHPGTNTITLNHAKITKADESGGISAMGGLTVNVVGDCSIELDSSIAAYGIYVDDLVLTGSGNLEIRVDNKNYNGIRVWNKEATVDMDGDLTIDAGYSGICVSSPGDVTISGTGNVTIHADYSGILANYGDVTISGTGNVTIDAECGIYSINTTLTNSGTVSITGVNKGIYASRGTAVLSGDGFVDIKSSGSSGVGIEGAYITFSNSGDVKITSESYGIVTDEDIAITGSGEVRFETVSRAIFSYGGLTISGDGDVVILAQNDGIYTYNPVIHSGKGVVTILSGNNCIQSCKDVRLSGSGGVILFGKAGIASQTQAVLSSSGDVTIVAGQYGITVHEDVAISGIGDVAISSNLAGVVSTDGSLVLSGRGNVNIYGKEAGVQLWGGEHCGVFINGRNPTIGLKADSGYKAVINNSTGKSYVAGIHIGMYKVTGDPAYESVTYTLETPIPADCGGDPGACALSQFKDVPGYTNWAHKGIEYCVVNGLMSGTSATAFSPKTSMSRAMLVTVLYRMAGQPGAGQSKFSDVPANQWYSAAVSWAADKGIVSGVGGGKFDPNGNVTREQIATILFRYASFKGYDTAKRDNLSGFADASKVGSWFVDGMKWAVAEGLISGTAQNGKTYLSPQGAATREQVAAILMRFCENVAK